MIKTIKPLLSDRFIQRHYFTLFKYKQVIQQVGTNTSIFLGKTKRFIFPLPYPKLESGELNLHIGCGNINHPKFINIDGLPAPHIHHVRAINDLSIFKDETVDLIYASHCLEHFPHATVHLVLAEWFRVLKKGGILRLSIPDFDLLLKIYQDSGRDVYSIMGGLMGGQDYKYNFHMVIFNQTSVTNLLKTAGFVESEAWQPNSAELTTFHDYSSFEFHVNGQDYPVSLNIQARK
jgi:predicted SAM-dependent methyltransferase